MVGHRNSLRLKWWATEIVWGWNVGIGIVVYWQPARRSASKRRSSSRTLELFQKQRWGTSERRDGAHTGFFERTDTLLNWTELKCYEIHVGWELLYMDADPRTSGEVFRTCSGLKDISAKWAKEGCGIWAHVQHHKVWLRPRHDQGNPTSLWWESNPPGVSTYSNKN